MTHAFPISNSVPVHRLAACFNNTSATFWLLAVLDGIQQGGKELHKHQLFASMIANAWYTVNYFNASFGQQVIQDAVRQIKEIEGITIDAQKTVIKSRLVETDYPLTHK